MIGTLDHHKVGAARVREPVDHRHREDRVEVLAVPVLRGGGADLDLAGGSAGALVADQLDPLGRQVAEHGRREAVSDRHVVETRPLPSPDALCREIARRLFLSEATVKTYVSRLLTKLDATNRVQVAMVVHDAGLV